MNEEALRKQLPIGENEKILATIRHHWFAYVSVFVSAGFMCLLVIGLIILVGIGGSDLGLPSGSLSIASGLGILVIAIIIAFSFIPVWIKKQEVLILTEEALLQVKKPSVFASKVSQLNLQHIADVTVDQNTIGTMFGFAHLTIETPGEQDNYEFSVVANARDQAKAIIEAHENYVAALESGQIQTTLGERPAVPGTAWRDTPPQPQSQQTVAPSVDQPDSQAPQGYTIPPVSGPDSDTPPDSENVQ